MTINTYAVIEHLTSYLQHEYQALKNQDFEELSRMALAKIDLMEKFEREAKMLEKTFGSVDASPYAQSIESLITMTHRNQAILTGMMEGLEIVISAFDKTKKIAQTAGIYTPDGSPYEIPQKNELLGSC